LALNIEPETDMNPVVLSANNGHLDIIVRGHPSAEVSSLPVAERPGHLRPIIINSYQKLAAKYEFVIMEGCGSPVELNLRDRDLVNLWVAETFDAPCILVAERRYICIRSWGFDVAYACGERADFGHHPE
jgi:adenosylcobyric acid synthase